MKRIRVDALQPGDIVLTATRTKIGKGVRLATRGTVSHAMICVQHGSLIDSTSIGVHSRNVQRELFGPDEKVFAFRTRNPLDAIQLARIVDFARSAIGTRYSNTEAARTLLGKAKHPGKRQFCSRLVAGAYASAGLALVQNKNYCTPEDLRTSKLLMDLGDLTEVVSEEELAAWRDRPDPISAMQSSQNAILDAARKLDRSVEHFSDIDQLLSEHLEWDAEMAAAYRSSGYLDIWRNDFAVNPWHYDLQAMNSFGGSISEMRAYCMSTIREAHSGGFRFAANLRIYEAAHARSNGETAALLVELYGQLVRNHQLRCDTAVEWLEQNFPGIVAAEMQQIAPHSDLWFDMVDRVEPTLGRLARIWIDEEKSLDVCSSCGDPAKAYQLRNSGYTMPGVPSLSLCDDCVAIRRAKGELLEPFPCR